MAPRILLVEDDLVQAEFMRTYLEDLLPGCTVQHVATELAFRELFPSLQSSPPDLVVVDMMIRWSTPSSQVQPLPGDVARDGQYRAGRRCQELLASETATRDVPVVIYSVLERLDAIPGNEQQPYNVVFLQKSTDLSPLGQLIISLLTSNNPTYARSG